MRSRIFATAIIATLSLVPNVVAQTPSAAETVVDRRAARRAAAEIFHDRSKPEKERLAALPRMRFPDKAMAARLLATGADRSESDTIRLEALKKHPFTDRWLDLVLAIIDDAGNGGEVLDAGLTELLNQRATFKLPAEVRQRIQAAWRKLLDDPRPRVRLAAYRVLIANHDPVAINRLTESMRGGGPVPIPLQDAVELLEIDGPTSHLSVLRPLLTHRDARVRARAARALASDSQSQAMVVRLANDPEQPDEVRRYALRGLAREDERYASYAVPLIENSRDDGDARYWAMHAYAGRLNYNRSSSEEQIRFVQAVERLMNDQSLRSTAASRIREEARELIESMKRRFPAVKQFYATR